MADNAFGTGRKATKKKNEASHFLLWDFEKKRKYSMFGYALASGRVYEDKLKHNKGYWL